jgi:hypothetical protein
LIEPFWFVGCWFEQNNKASCPYYWFEESYLEYVRCNHTNLPNSNAVEENTVAAGSNPEANDALKLQLTELKLQMCEMKLQMCELKVQVGEVMLKVMQAKEEIAKQRH